MPDDTQTEAENEPRIAQEPRPRRVGLLTRMARRLSRRRDPEPSIIYIMAQWAEYQVVFNDLLTRHSALLARQAKMEKQRQERERRENPQPTPAAPVTGKAALRSLAAQRMYGDRIAQVMSQRNGGTEDEPSEQGSPS